MFSGVQANTGMGCAGEACRETAACTLDWVESTGGSPEVGDMKYLAIPPGPSKLSLRSHHPGCIAGK